MALPALMDHQSDQTIVETCLVSLEEPIMKPVPDVIDLRGSFLHYNLIMINLGFDNPFKLDNQSKTLSLHNHD